MCETEYYDGTKLLSMKDLNGDRPEIYICSSNRSAGKTTYFNRLLVNRFLDKKEKFALLYRFNYELDACANKFFSEIGRLFFKKMTMTSKRLASGIFHELFIDDVACGYALSLNSSDQIKKYSHLFSDAKRVIFDEFQSETNHYCSNEVQKFISVHTSMARGGGKQSRYLPVYLLANNVTLLNPYYTALGISDRLEEKTNFLRGKGFVLEQGFNVDASKAQKNSTFNKAFEGNSYVDYASEKVYLNDNKAFIAKPTGMSRYMATLKYEGKNYAIREYKDDGCIYCDNRVDESFPKKISVTTDDHQINYVMLKNNDILIMALRWYFEHGVFRFKDLDSKSAVLKALAYY